MSQNIEIPQIAITLEPNDDNNDSFHGNIADALTDIEDLDEPEEKVPVRKSKLKIKINKDDDGGVTDFEDMDASDDDSDSKPVQTVSLADLELEVYNTEETFLENNNHTQENSRRHSQSLGTTTNLLQPFHNDEDDGLTDAENFNTDDESGSEEIPEASVNLDEYQSDFVSESSSLKPKGGTSFSDGTNDLLTSPVVEVNEFTDIESMSDSGRENHVRKNKPKRKKTKGRHRNCEAVLEADDVTDDKKNKRCAKIKKSHSHPLSLKCDEKKGETDREDNQCHLKFPVCQKMVPNDKFNLTDTEDIDGDFDRRPGTISMYNIARIDIGAREMQKCMQVRRQILNDDSTDEESLRGHVDDQNTIDLVLPQSSRISVILHENNSLVPTTKIQPLGDNYFLGLGVDRDEDGHTDIEDLNDPDEQNPDGFLDVDSYDRGPTPDVQGYENTVILNEEGQHLRQIDLYQNADNGSRLNVTKLATSDLPTTDTEDLYLSDASKPRVVQRKASNASVTDSEEFDTDDEHFARNINRDRVRVISPYLVGEVISEGNQDQVMYLKGGSYDDGDVELSLGMEVGSIYHKNGMLQRSQRQEKNSKQKRKKEMDLVVELQQQPTMLH